MTCRWRYWLNINITNHHNDFLWVNFTILKVLFEYIAKLTIHLQNIKQIKTLVLGRRTFPSVFENILIKSSLHYTFKPQDGFFLFLFFLLWSLSSELNSRTSYIVPDMQNVIRHKNLYKMIFRTTLYISSSRSRLWLVHSHAVDCDWSILMQRWEK